MDHLHFYKLNLRKNGRATLCWTPKYADNEHYKARQQQPLMIFYSVRPDDATLIDKT